MTRDERAFLEGLEVFPGLFKSDSAVVATCLRTRGFVECEVFDRDAGLWIGRVTDAGRAALAETKEPEDERS